MRMNGASERSLGLMVSAKPGVASGVAILRRHGEASWAPPLSSFRQNFVKTEGFPRVLTNNSRAFTRYDYVRFNHDHSAYCPCPVSNLS
jgi:hypothetical protein